MAERVVERAEKRLLSVPKLLARQIEATGCHRTAALVGAIQIDSPITTAFVVLCFLVQCANVCVPTAFISRDFFGVSPWSHFQWTSWLSWVTLFTHVVGHGSWSHLQGNVVYLLLVSPAVERHWGSYSYIKILLVVALSSALAHMVFGTANTVQLGASGVVFSLILLNSLIAYEHRRGSGSVAETEGVVPLTFILQIFFWVWNEVLSQLFAEKSHIAHIAHLAGAAAGTVAGLSVVPKPRRQEQAMPWPWCTIAAFHQD